MNASIQIWGIWDGANLLRRDNWGSAIIILQDTKTLDKIHIEALVGYICDEVKPLLIRSTSGYKGEDKLMKEDVVAMVNRARFVEYWNKFIAGKRGRGDKRAYVSPYDI